MIRLEVQGEAELRRRISDTEVAITRGPAPKVWKQLADELRKYPPPPPNSKYKRTYKLQRGWQVGFGQANDVGGMFHATNNVSYAPYVQGTPAEQAAIHRGRWTPAIQILEKFRDRIVREWEALISRAAGS